MMCVANVCGLKVYFMPKHIQKRRRLWYAVLDIPKDVRDVIGKPRFVQSLKTDSRSHALSRAAVLVAKWKEEIEAARTGTRDPIERDDLFCRAAIQEASTDDAREQISAYVGDIATDMAAASAPADEVGRPGDTKREDLPGHADAGRFHGFATDYLVKTDDRLEEDPATTEATDGAAVKRLTRRLKAIKDRYVHLHWPPLIGLGLYLIYIAFTWAGLPMEVPWFDAGLAAIDVMVFQPNIVSPSMLLIGAGFGLGFYFPRIIDRLIPKLRRYDLEKQNRLERTRAALDVFQRGVEKYRREGLKEPI